MSDKRALRCAMRALPPLSPAAKAARDAALRARLFELLVLEHQRAKVCALFWPFPTEVDLRPLLTQLEQFGRTIALPVLSKDPEVRPMRFGTWTDGQTMARSNFSVKEPTGPEVTPDLIVVPGLAFDLAGGRLGRGKGHYDSTIAPLRAANAGLPLIGVCHERCVVERVPCDDWDERMTHLVTESRTITI